MAVLEELRTSPRSAYAHPVQFDVNCLGSEGLMSTEQKGFGVDISKYGFGLLTRYPLKKGEVLRLHLPLDSSQSGLPIFARVAWTRRADRQFRVGMQFLT